MSEGSGNKIKIGWLLGLVVLVLGGSGQNTVRSVSTKQDLVSQKEIYAKHIQEFGDIKDNLMTKEQATWLINYFDLSLSTVIEYLPEDQRVPAIKRLEEIRKFREIGMPSGLTVHGTSNNSTLQASMNYE